MCVQGEGVGILVGRLSVQICVHVRVQQVYIYLCTKVGLMMVAHLFLYEHVCRI